ncbi:hypothetical protein Peur_042772 [Populus x canadensis]
MQSCRSNEHYPQDLILWIQERIYLTSDFSQLGMDSTIHLLCRNRRFTKQIKFSRLLHLSLE